MNAFEHAIECLQSEQQAHVRNWRRFAGMMLELGFTAETVEEILGPVDEIEAGHRELLSHLAALHELETS